ncbi:membrane protein [Bordetella trematum]|uniref:Membrane protein n=1 Tax=Bordetella trematum TaxID=123899 RepID=A0A157SMX3_9BORD|nr:membrane protein [Bordetella trematum]SAI63109.1 membrane protein [Bordetella trematum]SAI71246.1 membrane protein [Bordetella trematum]SUV98330.1 membrane protein [Bordetella trematum]
MQRVSAIFFWNDVKAPNSGAAMLRYRFAVASRALAAIGGGYALASAAAACLAVWLPMSRVDAVVTAQMLAFVVYACGVIWVFATYSAWRAWGGIMVPTALLALLYWMGAK